MVDVKQFAERVERMCDFIIGHLPTDTADRRAIQDLQEDAADIQASLGPNIELELALDGIKDVIKR